jgi:hypothetical protein
MTNKIQSHEGENVILEYPYKAMGWLKITTSRLIFNKIFLGVNTFSGVINFSDIEEVKYLKGTSIFGVPGVEIVYRLSTDKITKVRIYFPSRATRLGIGMRSGITPEKVIETIMLIREKQSNNGIS